MYKLFILSLGGIFGFPAGFGGTGLGCFFFFSSVCQGESALLPEASGKALSSCEKKKLVT